MAKTLHAQTARIFYNFSLFVAVRSFRVFIFLIFNFSEKWFLRTRDRLLSGQMKG